MARIRSWFGNGATAGTVAVLSTASTSIGPGDSPFNFVGGTVNIVTTGRNQPTLLFPSSTAIQRVGWAIPATVNGLATSFTINMSGTATSQNTAICQGLTATQTTQTFRAEVALTTNFIVLRNAANTVVATSTGAITPGNDYRVEIIIDSSGNATINVYDYGTTNLVATVSGSVGSSHDGIRYGTAAVSASAVPDWTIDDLRLFDVNSLDEPVADQDFYQWAQRPPGFLSPAVQFPQPGDSDTSSTGLTSVTSTRATTWDTLASAASAQATAWSTLTSTSATRTTSWAVLATVAATRATSWTTLAAASSTRATAWATRGLAAATRATTWNALASTLSTRATSWSTAASVLATRATQWATLASVAATRATSWNVAANLTSVTATRATTWATRASTSSARATTWSVLTPASNSRATTWTVTSSVTATRATTWTTRAGVTATRSTQWSALASTSATRSTTWATKAQAASARATSWSTLAPVTVTRATSWNVAALTIVLTPAGPEFTYAAAVISRRLAADVVAHKIAAQVATHIAQASVVRHTQEVT